MEHGQSIVAVTVTGSLESLALSGRRDEDGIYRPSALQEYCDAAWNLPLLCRTDGVAMNAAGFSIVDNRAGITFGVELYVPWNAPEMATDLSAKGTVPLRDVQDVFGMCGRCKGATESHILQGRDTRSVRVLLTGTTTPTPERPLGNASPQVTHVSGKTDDSCARLRPPTERPLGNASPRVTHMSDISDDSCARPRPPGRRRRSKRWIQNTATHVAPRLTEQDPQMAAGAVVFDCRPAVLPVSVDVSGIDIRTVHRAEPPAEPFVAPAERKQEFGEPMWLDHIDPELEVTPLLNSGTDCQDELLPSQGEDDINLTRILAEFDTLPAFVTAIVDQYAEGEMPPTEYHHPEVPPDLFVMPAGPVDDVSSTRDLTVPAVPTPEGEVSVPITYAA